MAKKKKIGSGTVTARPLKKNPISQRKAEKFLEKTNNAARKIQGMYLSWRAKRNIQKAAQSMYEELIDPESEQPYYLNLRTGETKWERPVWFLPPPRKDEDILEAKEKNEDKLKRLRAKAFDEMKDPRDWPIIFKNGETYEGQVSEEGVADGYGVWRYPKNGRYCGQFRIGMANGVGVRTFKDGSQYYGEWVNNQRHGFGVQTYLDGSEYAGNFVLDSQSGLGVFRNNIGLMYEGNFKNNEFDGYGIQWHFGMDKQSPNIQEYRAGLWKKGIFQNPTPKSQNDIDKTQNNNADKPSCSHMHNEDGLADINETDKSSCNHMHKEDDLTDSKSPKDEQQIVEYKNLKKIEKSNPCSQADLGFEAAREARRNLHIVFGIRKEANEARMKGNDERKKTQLVMDVKRAAALKGKYRRKRVNMNPYINYLEAQLKDSKKRIRFAERRLIHQNRMCNLAEAEWTSARSFNDKMKLERDMANGHFREAMEWKPVADERQATIAEMTETLLQLRVALHIGKKQHRILDRRGRDAMKKAAALQKKLSQHLASQKTPYMQSASSSLYSDNVGDYHDRPASIGFARSDLNTRGSSDGVFSPPSSPLRKPNIESEEALYFSPIRNSEGRAITPIAPINRLQLPSRGTQNTNHRPVSPTADEKYVSGFLDTFQAKPMIRNRKKIR